MLNTCAKKDMQPIAAASWPHTEEAHCSSSGHLTTSCAAQDDGTGRGPTVLHECVRVSTVDNYQGEEALIVLVSLVRSNPEGSIGFLKQPQRVNVLLSRARLAMILVGNAECLSRGSRGNQTWEKVLQHIPVVQGFPTLCEKHGAAGLMKEAGVFEERVPDGGCHEDCGTDLECGHKCGMKCHSARIQHACRAQVSALCVLSLVTAAVLVCMMLAQRLNWRQAFHPHVRAPQSRRRQRPLGHRRSA